MSQIYNTGHASAPKTLYGAIEAGGTKFICAVGTGPNALNAHIQIPTTTPTATIAQTVAFFDECQKQFGPLAAIGIGSFGPIDRRPDSSKYGFITSTPKPTWRDTNFVGKLKAAFPIPIGFDTDVNGAALAESKWGAGQGKESVLYLTIGTGIGGGMVVNGQPLHGLLHPEMGHIRLPRDPRLENFAGVCPYHGDCWEGLAAGPALEARYGDAVRDFAPNHRAWDIEAHYIALALSNLICTLSPNVIILGGGVMTNRHLFPMIREKVATYLNGYVADPAITAPNDSYIVPPALGTDAGILGAIALAMEATR